MMENVGKALADEKNSGATPNTAPKPAPNTQPALTGCIAPPVKTPKFHLPKPIQDAINKGAKNIGSKTGVALDPNAPAQTVSNAQKNIPCPPVPRITRTGGNEQIAGVLSGARALLKGLLTQACHEFSHQSRDPAFHSAPRAAQRAFLQRHRRVETPRALFDELDRIFGRLHPRSVRHSRERRNAPGISRARRWAEPGVDGQGVL